MANKNGTKGYSSRPGELRIGDCLRLPGDAPFVLFGIAEDLGIRTNGGRAGAAKSPEGVLTALLNISINEWVPDNLLAWGGILDLRKATSVDEIDKMVYATVYPWFQKGYIPLVIGGGHNNSMPLLWAAHDALDQPVNALNLDPHPDVRALEGRHSGNGFSYAHNRGYLDRYAVLGMSENSVNSASLALMRSTPGWTFETYESWAVRGETSWESAMDRMLLHVQNAPFGLEIDADGITGAPASAQTESGWSWTQARQLAYRAGQTGKVAYLHLSELALGLLPEDDHGGHSKAAAMLLLDFVRGTRNLPW